MALEPFPNLVAMFFARAAERGPAPFLWRKAGGRWRATTWGEAAAQVAAVATALPGLGLARGDRVLLVAENRPEWCIADLAIMAAGGVTVPAYITNTAADHAHVLRDSGATIAIVADAKLARALAPALAGTGVRALIAIEAEGVEAPAGIALHRWAALLAVPGDVAACAAAASFGPDDLACLIYTSGTGGNPRGVRHHHGAILHNVRATRAIIEQDFDLAGREGVFLSLLPLGHAYEHSAGQFLPIGLGGQIYYAEGLDRLAATIAEVRPEIMIVVPRLFELLRARITRQIGQEGRLARWLLARAVAIGPRPRRRDRPLAWLIGRTLRPRIAQRFGGRLMALVSGGAPLNPEVGGFFAALGLTILQGYGQTEAGPVISCNRPRAGIDMRTVGPPLDEVELRIAADGEILVRGPNVMHGYWRDEAETARALAGGWLHTGDVGALDAAGRLVITDRKKDIIVNDKGDTIAPQRIEGLLTLQPEIGQAMVAGDRRPYLVGLVVPDAGWAAEWAAARGLDAAASAADPAFRAALTAAVERVNAGLAPVEKVRRVAVADEPFTIDNGEMTPSLKVRRHVLRQRYGARLDALYR